MNASACRRAAALHSVGMRGSRMPDTVPVTIEVEPRATAALGNPHTRAAMGCLASSMPSP